MAIYVFALRGHNWMHFAHRQQCTVILNTCIHKVTYKAPIQKEDLSVHTKTLFQAVQRHNKSSIKLQT